MTVFRIENEQACVEVSEQASEITSFKDLSSGIEYMWQGDPAFWKGRNPTLFPMVGSTFDKKIRINGKIYEMGNHGFARHALFQCVKHSDDEIVMELRDTTHTLLMYPYHFCLQITYTLEGKKLNVAYAISNEGEEDMPFHFGLHPAFNCPLTPDEKQSDYHLELNTEEDVNGIVTNRIELERSALEKTIILNHPKTTVSTLTNGTHGVEVEAHEYEWLAFWSAKNAPFVCIEPWMSHTDFEPLEIEYAQREGTIVLKPGEVFRRNYTIRIF